MYAATAASSRTQFSGAAPERPGPAAPTAISRPEPGGGGRVPGPQITHLVEHVPGVALHLAERHLAPVQQLVDGTEQRDVLDLTAGLRPPPVALPPGDPGAEAADRVRRVRLDHQRCVGGCEQQRLADRLELHRIVRGVPIPTGTPHLRAHRPRPAAGARIAQTRAVGGHDQRAHAALAVRPVRRNSNATSRSAVLRANRCNALI